MLYDYTLLRKRIKEYCGTLGTFAKAINTTPQRMSRLMHNNTDWTQTDISLAIKVLGIRESEIGLFFYSIISQK